MVLNVIKIKASKPLDYILSSMYLASLNQIDCKTLKLGWFYWRNKKLG